MGWPKGKPRKAVVHEDAPLEVIEPVLSMTAEEVTAHAMASGPDQVGIEELVKAQLAHNAESAQPNTELIKFQVQLIPNPVPIPPSCAICCFWHPTGELNHGQCRRFPAHPRNNSPYASWPVMAATDWCGEFQASFQHFKAKV